MNYSGKITRFNMYQLSPYDRLQYQRGRKAEALEIAQKQAALANGLAAIQKNQAVALGNLVSRVAMQRIYKRV
ncbi:hypothetical protein [Devosia sp. Naph2]|uniref:hypothetical protein n=1 Tax=Devosia polycyclovorans TaxID=3345148 RepID=UPI0035CFC71F